MARKCAFCTSQKLTREHIWSDWINSILPPTKYNFRRKNEDGSHSQWQLPELAYKSRVACNNCNSGWMSDLEQHEAKPTMADMIRYGRAVSLLPRGIASIAAFAFKTSVVSNSMGFFSKEPFFTLKERYHFRRTLEVPAGVQIWLFSVNTPIGISGKLNSYFGKFPVSVPYGFKIYVCTFSIGFLGLQLVASKWANPRLRHQLPFPGFRQDDKWDDLAIPAWPNSGMPVSWPPTKHVSNDAINQFCNRWRDFDIPRWMAELPS